MTLRETFPEVGAPMPTTVDPVTEALIRTRELIADPRRWIKNEERVKRREGIFRRPVYSYCLVGALLETDRMVESPDSLAAFRRIDKVIKKRTLFGCPISFNDSPGTAHADVLAVLDEAIAG